MGLQHIQHAPVSQGKNQNYCWAASLSWWLKAVRGYNYDMDTPIERYDDWINWEGDKNFGPLTEIELEKLINDQSWRLWFELKRNDKITIDYLSGLLARGPVMVAYSEPQVEGYHMNVIVAGAGLGDVASGLVVMDPNYQSFQIRSLKYYKEYYSKIAFIYLTTLGPEPTYGYVQSS